jgi:hypothetical protein
VSGFMWDNYGDLETRAYLRAVVYVDGLQGHLGRCLGAEQGPALDGRVKSAMGREGDGI